MHSWNRKDDARIARERQDALRKAENAQAKATPEPTDPLDHRANIAKRLISLRAKLNARKGNPAFAENVPALEAEIARLEGLMRYHEQGGDL